KGRHKFACRIGPAAAFAVVLAAVAWGQDRPINVKLSDSTKELQSASVVGHALKLAEEPLQHDELQRIRLPRGFSIRIFAENLKRPRMMAVSGDTVYVAEQESGQVPAFDASTTSERRTGRMVAQGLDSPHGLAVHGGHLYVATV